MLSRPACPEKRAEWHSSKTLAVSSSVITSRLCHPSPWPRRTRTLIWVILERFGKFSQSYFVLLCKAFWINLFKILEKISILVESISKTFSIFPRNLEFFRRGWPTRFGRPGRVLGDAQNAAVIWEGDAQNAVTEALKKYLGGSVMCKCLLSVLSSKLPPNITQASTTKAKLLRVYSKAS